MNDIPVIIYGGSLLIYIIWFIIFLERFRSRNTKNHGILEFDLRRVRRRATIISLSLPILSFGLTSAVSFLLGLGLPIRSQTLLVIIICPGGLWLFSMLALWSFTIGWRVISYKGVNSRKDGNKFE